MYSKECKWCREIIVVEKQPHFASHVSTCKHNPNLENRKKELSLKLKGKFLVKRIDLIKKCLKCGSEFEVCVRESEIRRNKVRNYCSLRCGNSRPKTDETKEKISIGVKNSEVWKANTPKSKNNTPNLDNPKSKFTCLGCGKKGYNSKKGIREYHIKCKPREILSRESRNFICLYCGNIGHEKYKKGRKYHSDCWKKCSGGIRNGSSRGKSGWYKGYWCDSSYELAFVIYNLDHGIEFKRNLIGFNYTYEGKSKLFYPDFIIDNGYVEIKNYKSDLTDAKIRNFPHKISVIYRDEITPYINYAKNKYGKDFIKIYDPK